MRMFLIALFAAVLTGCGGGGSSTSVQRENLWLMRVVESAPSSTLTVMEKHCSSDNTHGHGSANVGCDPEYAPSGLIVSLGGTPCIGVTVSRVASNSYVATSIVSPPASCFVTVRDPKTGVGTAGAMIGVVIPDPGPAVWPQCPATPTVVAADPMPPINGAIAGDSRTSITVPRVHGVDGATLMARDNSGVSIAGGVFTASGTNSETATLPAIARSPLNEAQDFEAWAQGVPCGPAIDFGGFVVQ